MAAVSAAHPEGRTPEAGMAGVGGGEELGGGQSSGMFGLALGARQIERVGMLGSWEHFEHGAMLRHKLQRLQRQR